MNRFLARQPIFDCREKVVAYELLFRSAGSTDYTAVDHDAATINVLFNAFLLFGIDKITNSKPAFINFTRNILRQAIDTCLPVQSIVIEILEDIEPDEEVITICKQLKQRGYVIALDDFVFSDKYRDLIELADIIKIDFLTTSVRERQAVISRIRNPRIDFLAEKVETRRDFEQAVIWGYSYFQGYFFSKPETLSEKDLPSYNLQYHRILQEIQKPNLDFNRLEEIIKNDISFFYKLLKYINSVHFGLKSPVSSVRQALVLLGQRQIEQWVTLLIMRDLSQEKPEEVMTVSVMRAKFGELLAQKMNKPELASQAFLMGLFSLIDCLLHRPLPTILQELPIADAVKQALLGADTILGDILSLILAYEKGDWHTAFFYAGNCSIPNKTLPGLYLQALNDAMVILNKC